MKIKTKVKAGNRCGGPGLIDNDIQSFVVERFSPTHPHPHFGDLTMKIKTKVKAGGRCGGGAGLDI